MILKRIKHTAATVVAVATAFFCLLGVWSMGATRFPTLSGRRTYYTASKSSQALIKTRLSPLDFSLVRGESVECASPQELESLLTLFRAKILFEEEVDGVHSYYCYTEAWTDGVRVGEYFVNLHVAFSEGRCVVGSPIIFGGF